MNPQSILLLFLGLKLFQHLLEQYLLYANRRYYEDLARQRQAQEILKIDDESMAKTLAYSRDKYRFNLVSSWVSFLLFVAFLWLGGFGWVEQAAQSVALPLGGGEIVTGLLFFAILGLLSMVAGLPFQYYFTFKIENKHGFNRQTPKGFFGDLVKTLILSAVLGGAILSVILYIIEVAGDQWWLLAWLVTFLFSVLTAWLYPTLLAPLFNKFKPIETGELRDKIFQLAARINFKAGEIYVMDASKRSSHGNAYFTGVFGKKRIVLFDTLVNSMNTDEVVAVLAHELGHFKLHHIRWALIRAFFMTGLMFYAASFLVKQGVFYLAFYFSSPTAYAALVVMSLWIGIISYFFQPLSNLISQKNEFAADAFALQNIEQKNNMKTALLKLRETSKVMPLSHPLFSIFHLSHPPLLERLKVL